MEKPRDTLVNLELVAVYRELLDAFGPRGWWPLDHRAGQPGHDAEGYHPRLVPPDFGPPDIWCVFAGAILTQRSTWLNARRALGNLLRLCSRKAGGQGAPGLPVGVVPGAVTPGAGSLVDPGTRANAFNFPEPGCLSRLDPEELAEAVRPSGFFRRKALRLQELESRLLEAGFFDPDSPCPSRKDLLALPGLGPESADVLWTYARLETGFVSDAYTARIFSRLAGRPEGTLKYNDCQDAVCASWGLVLEHAKPGHRLDEALEIAGKAGAGDELREFHALLVELGKRYCRSVPDCRPCPLRARCAASPKG